MKKSDVRADQVIRDLERIYKIALKTGKLTIALKAKELIGKAFGLFKTPPSNKIPLISELSDEQLEHMISSVQQDFTIENKNEERKFK